MSVEVVSFRSVKNGGLCSMFFCERLMFLCFFTRCSMGFYGFYSHGSFKNMVSCGFTPPKFNMVHLKMMISKVRNLKKIQ